MLFSVALLLCVFCVACGGGGNTEASEQTQNDEITSADELLEGNPLSNFNLTQGHINSLIAMLEDLKANEKTFDSKNVLSEMASLQKYTIKHGFQGVEEFAQVYQKIFAGVTLITAEEENEKQNFDEQFEKAVVALEEQLKDPNISDEQKEGIRQSIEQQKQLLSNGGAMSQLRNSYGKLISDKEVSLIKQNIDKLRKAFERM